MVSCTVPLCTTSTNRNPFLSFFHIANLNKVEYRNSDDQTKKDIEEWRKHLLLWCRREPPFTGAHICSRHFTEDDYFMLNPDKGRRKLKTFRMPSLHGPMTSHPTIPVQNRQPPKHRQSPVQVQRVYYYTLDDVQRDIDVMKHERWIQLGKLPIILGVIDGYIIKKRIIIDETLKAVFYIKETKVGEVAVDEIGLKQTMAKCDALIECSGIGDEALQSLVSVDAKSSNSTSHCYRTVTRLGGEMVSTIWSNTCNSIASSWTICGSCAVTKSTLTRVKSKSSLKTIKPKTPLAKVNDLALLRKEVFDLRSNKRELQKKISKMSTMIEK